MRKSLQRRTDGENPARGGPVACSGGCQEAWYRDVTIYAWRKRFGQLEPADVELLRQLEQENAKLKRLLAERDLEIDVMKEVAAKNGERAGASSAGGVRARTQRVAETACALMSVARSRCRRKQPLRSSDRGSLNS
jgi:hypothetical protein